jgi:hypothetical protein
MDLDQLCDDVGLPGTLYALEAVRSAAVEA